MANKRKRKASSLSSSQSPPSGGVQNHQATTTTSIETRPHPDKRLISSSSSSYDGNPFTALYNNKLRQKQRQDLLKQDSDDDLIKDVIRFTELTGRNRRRVDDKTMTVSSERWSTSSTDKQYQDDDTSDENQNDDDFDDQDTSLDLSSLSPEHHTHHREDHHSLLVETIKRLLDFLTVQTTPTNRGGSSLISKVDTIKLLLPWTIREIMMMSSPKNIKKQNKDDEGNKHQPEYQALVASLQWRVLLRCLEYLHHETSTRDREIDGNGAVGESPVELGRSNTTHHLLSLSTLHKLIPVVLRCSILRGYHDEDEDNDDRQHRRNTATKCYCLLVEQFYQPTFDAVCDSLLPLLLTGFDDEDNGTRSSQISSIGQTKKKTINNGASHIQKSNNLFEVTCSTLRLVRSRWQSANPKKSFQLLVRPTTFVSLAKLYYHIQFDDGSRGMDIMKDLIRCAIFDIETHMEGFRSVHFHISSATTAGGRDTSKEADESSKQCRSSPAESMSTFQCYQQGLVAVLDHFLGDRSEETKNIPHDQSSTEEVSADSLAVASLTPLLLEIFFEQTTQMQRDLQKNQHLVDRLSSKKLKSMQKLGEIQFRFFAKLSNNILSWHRTRFDTVTAASAFSIVRQNVDLLLKFNIYQPSMNNPSEKAFLDRVAVDLVSALSSKEMTTDVSLTKSMRDNIFKGLEILIQLNHLCLHANLSVVLGPCLTYITQEEKQNAFDQETKTLTSPETLDLLSIILSTYSKLRQLDVFIQIFVDCIFQMLDNGLNSGLMTWLSLLEDGQIQCQIGAAVSSSPIQQVKVTVTSLNQSIVKLISGSRSHLNHRILAASVLSKALECTMAAIPLDTATSTAMSNLSLDVMNKAVSEVSNDLQSPERVQIAVSLCAATLSLKNRCDFWLRTDNVSQDMDSLDLTIPFPLWEFLQERISNKASHKGTSLVLPRGAVQLLVCEQMQHLHATMMAKERISFSSDFEVFAVKSEQVELSRLCSYLVHNAGLNDDCFEITASSMDVWAQHSSTDDVDSFLDILLNMIALESVSESNHSSGTNVLSILQDASFYETPSVAPQLGKRVMVFVENNLLEAVASLRQNDRRKSDLALAKCMKVLQFIVGSDLPVWHGCVKAGEVFNACLQLENTCLSLLNEYEVLPETWMMSVAMLRLVASKVIISVDKRELQFTSIGDILKGSELLLRLWSGDAAKQLVLQSGGMLVASLLDCVDSGGKEAAYEAIEVLPSLFMSIPEVRGVAVFSVFASFIVQLIHRLDWASSLDTENFSGDVLDFVQAHLWPMAVDFCIHNNPQNGFFRNLSVELIASLLRWAPESVLKQRFDISQLEDCVLKRVKAILRNSDQQESSKSKMVHQHDVLLVTSFATTHPSREFRNELIGAIIGTTSSKITLLEPAVCALVPTMETDEFSSFLGRFLNPALYSKALVEKTSMVHAILVSGLKDERSVDVIAKLSSTIVGNCIQNLFHGHKADREMAANVITETVALIIEIGSRKDVLALRERDIALLLTGIASAFKTFQSQSTKLEVTSSSRAGSIAVFNACFSLMAFILQRFSKQAHSCVPSVIVVLNVMMEQVIKYPMDEETIRICGQKFSRLIELLLPHMDVYKKHIVCLVVKFVDGLTAEMDVFRKNALMPAIFCLFDMIQQHETLQLNSMLDEVGRVVLRPVHENYKKVHVYKGQ